MSTSDKVYDQTGDYIPKSDDGFRNWLQNFSNLIQQDAARYGLQPPDAAVISGMYTDFDTVFALVQSPATRTPGLVLQKDAIKASSKASCRVYAQQIKANAGVSDQDKLQLGLHINDTTKTPIPAPSSAPILNITGAFSGEHILRYADENTPTSRAKPPGVTQMELYVHVGPGATADWQEAEYVGVFTKNPIQYTFTPDKAGMTATYFARWRTAKGLEGPMSLGTAMQIAFGGPVDQQMPMGGTTLTGSSEEGETVAA